MCIKTVWHTTEVYAIGSERACKLNLSVEDWVSIIIVIMMGILLFTLMITIVAKVCEVKLYT